jgi:hypothetical protein
MTKILDAVALVVAFAAPAMAQKGNVNPLSFACKSCR